MRSVHFLFFLVLNTLCLSLSYIHNSVAQESTKESEDLQASNKEKVVKPPTKAVSTKAVSTKAVSTKAVSTKAVSTKAVSTKAIFDNIHTSRLSRRADYAVEITQPAHHWRLIAPAHLKKLSPLAVLAAIEPGRILGMVLSEPVKHLTLEQYTQALMDHSSLESIVLESSTYETIQNYKTIRLVYTGENTQGRFRYLNYIFLKDQYGFQINAGGKINEVQATDLELFFKSINLLPMNVQGKHFKTKGPTHQVSHNVSVNNGILKSLHTGLKLAVPQGYSVLLGEELDALNIDADFALTLWEPDLHILVAHTPCPVKGKNECISVLQKNVRQRENLKSSGEVIQLQLLQKQADFTQYSSEKSTFTYVHHVHIHGKKSNKALQILAWTTRGQELKAWPMLGSLLSQIQMMEDVEKTQLKVQLIDDKKLNTSNDTFRRDESWMQHTYRHHVLRLSWQQPIGAWKVLLNSETKEDIHKLSMIDPIHGMHSQMRIIPAINQDLAYTHQQAWQALKRELNINEAKTKEQSTAGAFTYGIKHQQSLYQQIEVNQLYPILYRLDTLQVGQAIVHLITWGSALNFEIAIVAQILSALEHESHYNITQDADTWSDYRFRFRLQHLPKGGSWQFQPYSGIGTASTAVTYQTPKEVWGAVAMGQSYHGHLEQVAQDIAHRWFQSGPQHPIKEEASTQLQGYKVRHFSMSDTQKKTQQSFHLYLLERSPLIYGFFIYKDTSPLDSKAALKHFELLSP
jgi:hypothetical protein